MHLLLIMIKKHYMSWEHWPFNNCLGTLASQHCKNTLFKMGVQNLGCYIQPNGSSVVKGVHSFGCVGCEEERASGLELL
jgi:hypothetical protein